MSESKSQYSKPQYLMPHGSLVGLLLTMCACYAPHITRVPSWLTALAIFCMGYRVLIHRQRAQFPGGIFKACLAVVSTWLLLRNYGTLMAPDGGVAFLLVGYFLKTLEMHYRRDAMVMMLLSFFVIPMQFLYQTDLVSALWVAFCYFLIVATLVSFSENSTAAFSLSAYRTSLRLLGTALPVMIVLFLFFPRLPPFWQLPSVKSSQTIGLNDQLNMESLGNLFSSGGVAFRAEFDRITPEKRDLYWRGVVMEQFDGQTWSARKSGIMHPASRNAEHDRLHYRIYLEPTQQRILFALAPLLSWGGIDAIQSANGSFHSRENIVAQSMYWVESGRDPLQVQPFGEVPASLEKNTLLPPLVAPRTRETANKLYRSAGKDVEKFVQSIRQFIFDNEFSYTLSPPKLSGDTVDDFLFRTRAGYCSHYASAAAVMLRSVGIPARVIGGYQGGEYQPSGNYWIVHQYDAHAWVEYFLPDAGWRRFDPTAAISPARIEQGMDGAGSSLNGELLSAYAVNQWPMIRELRRSIDYLNYQWIVRVVGYKQENQTEMVMNLFGSMDFASWGPTLIAAIMSCGGLLLFYVNWRERPPRLNAIDALIAKAISRAERRFRKRQPGETIAAFSADYAKSGRDGGDQLLQLCEQYHRLRFQADFGTSSPVRTKTAKRGNDKLLHDFVSFKHRIKRFK